MPISVLTSLGGYVKNHGSKYVNFLVLLAFVSLFMLFGCTTRVSINSSNTTSLNLGSENVYAGEGFSLYLAHRYVPIFHVNIINLSDSPSVNRTELGKYISSVSNLMSSVKSELSDCDSKLGLKGVSCADAYTCVSLCRSSSQECSYLVSKYGDVFGDILLDYAKLSKEIKSDISSIYSFGENPYLFSIDDISSYFSYVADLINNVNQLRMNPIASGGNTSICTISQISPDKYLVALGSTYTETGYINGIFMDVLNTSENERGLSTYDVALTGKCKSLLSAIPSQHASLLSTSGKCAVSFSSLPTFVTPYIYVVYKTSTSPGVLQYSVDKKGIDTTLLYPAFVIFDVVNSATNSSITAAGVSIGLYIVIIMLLINLSIILFHTLEHAITQGSLHDGLWKGASRVPITWKSDLTISIIMLIVSVFTYMYAQGRYYINLVLVLWGIVSSSLYLSFIHVLSVAFFIVFVFLSINNRIRIYIMERTYVSKRNKELARISKRAYKILHGKFMETKKLMNDLNGKGVDIGDSMDAIASVDAKELFRINSDPKESDVKTLDAYESVLNKELTRLSKLNSLMNSSFSKWKSKVISIVNKNNSASIDDIYFVPKALRVWLLSKIAKEEPGFEFKGDMLIPLKLGYQELASSLANEKGVSVILLYKEELLGFAVSKDFDGVKTVVSALQIKLISYLHRVSLIYRSTGYMLSSFGIKHVLLVTHINDVDVALIVARDSLDAVLNTIRVKIRYVR